MGAMLLVLFSVFTYFIPTYVGRKKRNFAAIFVLNFFLGWTLVGWVVALVWAVTKDPQVAEATV
jgi:Superinfection immunity protein